MNQVHPPLFFLSYNKIHNHHGIIHLQLSYHLSNIGNIYFVYICLKWSWHWNAAVWDPYPSLDRLLGVCGAARQAHGYIDPEEYIKQNCRSGSTAVHPHVSILPIIWPLMEHLQHKMDKKGDWCEKWGLISISVTQIWGNTTEQRLLDGHFQLFIFITRDQLPCFRFVQECWPVLSKLARDSVTVGRTAERNMSWITRLKN